MCSMLRERTVALWNYEQLITAHVAAADSNGLGGYVEQLVTVDLPTVSQLAERSAC